MQLQANQHFSDMAATVFELKHVSNWGKYEHFGIVSLMICPCWAHNAAGQPDHSQPSIQDKLARLINRLLFGFMSDSVFVKLNQNINKY